MKSKTKSSTSHVTATLEFVKTLIPTHISQILTNSPLATHEIGCKIMNITTRNSRNRRRNHQLHTSRQPWNSLKTLIPTHIPQILTNPPLATHENWRWNHQHHHSQFMKSKMNSSTSHVTATLEFVKNVDTYSHFTDSDKSTTRHP